MERFIRDKLRKNPRRVLLIGGTGFVGKPLSLILLESNWEITIFADHIGEKNKYIRYIGGNRNSLSDFQKLKDWNFDVVVDLIPYLPAQSQMVVDLFQGKIEKFVHLSTIAVYQKYHKPFVNEDEVTRWDVESIGYAQNKSRCEYILEAAYLNTDFPYTIIRSSPVIGPGDNVSRENYLVKRILSREKIIYPGNKNHFISAVYVDDLVQAIALSLVGVESTGKAYHIGFENVPTFADHVNKIANLLDTPAPEILQMDWMNLLETGFRYGAFAHNPAIPWRLNIEKAKNDLGFIPTDYNKAIERTVKSLVENDPESTPGWPGWSSMQARLAGIHEFLHLDMEKRYLDKKELLWEKNADTFLEKLSGLSFGKEGILVAPREYWRSETDFPGMKLVSGDTYKNLLVPEEVFEIFKSDFLAQEVEGDSKDLSLAAVIEKAPSINNRLFVWLYVQTYPGIHQGYFHSPDVNLCEIMKFTKFSDTGEGSVADKVLLTVLHKDDRISLHHWLKERNDTGFMEVRSFKEMSKIYMILGPDFLDRDDLNKNFEYAHDWLFAFDLVRLLHRSGYDQKMKLRISTFKKPLFNKNFDIGDFKINGSPDVFLMNLDKKYYICSLVKKKIYLVHEKIAAAVEIYRYSFDKNMFIEKYLEIFEVKRSEAEMFYNKALEVILRITDGVIAQSVKEDI